ncbi:MAG: LD-carboxypeptidase [Crocinitomicaceae bacterium]
MRPERLRAGDKVIIVSPAGALDENYLIEAKDLLENWGLNPVISENSKQKWGKFSGEDEIRLNAFQEALDDPEIRAIFCARGGYGSTRILDELNWDRFLKCPKWIIGYSDITTFHNRLHQLNCESLHATMPVNYKTNNSFTMESLKNSLFKEPSKYALDGMNYNKPGKATGKMVGGNLSIVHNLIGTKFNIQFKDNILFIEEVGEYYYAIDRMLWALKHAGVFDEISGLIVGSFTELKQDETEFPESLEQMILKFVAHRNIPVYFKFPAGHQDENWTLVMAGRYKMEVTETDATIEYVLPGHD